MGKLEMHSPIYCIKDNWNNQLNLKHTLDRIYDYENIFYISKPIIFYNFVNNSDFTLA